MGLRTLPRLRWLGLGVTMALVLTSCKTTNSGLREVEDGRDPRDTTQIGAEYWDPMYKNKPRVCPNDEAAKRDFFRQLLTHRIYGNPDMFYTEGENGARVPDNQARQVFATYQRDYERQGNTPSLFKDMCERNCSNPEQFVVEGAKNVYTGNDPRDLAKLRKGDVLLNMGFGIPRFKGHFYSKRGMIHTRLVTKCQVSLESGTKECRNLTDADRDTITDSTRVSVTVADGGWGRTSTLRSMNNQSVWLRPKWPDTENLGEEDLEKIVKWALLFQSRDHDNQLIDDIAPFRKTLAKEMGWTRGGGANLADREEVRRILDGGSQPVEQPQPDPDPMMPDPVEPVAPVPDEPEPEPEPVRDPMRVVVGQAIERVYNQTYQTPTGQAIPLQAFRPETFWARNSEQNRDGKFYCSELATTAFTYLGFRLYGETPLEMLGKFSATGSNVAWKDYLAALSGFGAATDNQQVMIHSTFWSTFHFFEQTRTHPQLGQFWPEATRNAEMSFAKALTTLLRVENLQDDPVKAGLQGIAGSGAQPAAEQAQKLMGALDQVKAGLQESFGMPFPTQTSAINVLFQSNEAFGPHHFMENADYFKLIGVFYNTRSPAKWVDDWSFSAIDPFSEGFISHSGNLSTTRYQIDPAAGGDECTERQ